MDQEWFEMNEIRKRFYNNSVWIPIQESKTLIKEGKYGFAGYKEEYYGVGSILVPLAKKEEAEKIEWNDLGLNSSYGGYVQDGEYISAYSYRNWNVSFGAEYLIAVSRGNSINCNEWYLSPDLITTLNLIRENDSWLAIQFGYEEVVRMDRNENGCVIGLSIKSSYLKDYLCARRMALYITSYRSRRVVNEDTAKFNWDQPHIEEKGMDKWQGRFSPIHEGGHQFGSGFAVLHESRTDVDYDEDVPVLPFPTEEETTMNKREGKFKGRKLFHVEGELWRREWIEPAEKSIIILEEEVEPTAYFITDNTGKTENKKTLDGDSRWLWFKPSVINAVLAIRGSSLEWYTKDTGNIECSYGHRLHFGINSIGLINIYAKDIAYLPDWQQKIWAGHNVLPEGKVSAELLKSQMEAKPAGTQAPEAYIQGGLDLLNALSEEIYKFKIINESVESTDLINQIHRFKATNKEGLFSLSKDLYRIFGERINSKAIKDIVKPVKGEPWGPLKSLEKFLAIEIGEQKAYELLGPFWGIYKLRNADSHISISDLKEAFKLCAINDRSPIIFQSFQLLNTFVSSIYSICQVFQSLITTQKES